MVTIDDVPLLPDSLKLVNTSIPAEGLFLSLGEVSKKAKRPGAYNTRIHGFKARPLRTVRACITSKEPVPPCVLSLTVVRD